MILERVFEKAQNDLIRANSKLVAAYGETEAERLWADGFLADKSRLYQFELRGPGLYLTDIQREMTRVINGDFAVILNDKFVFQNVFQNAARLPRILAYTDGRSLIGSIGPEPADFYVKPIRGGGGSGVMRGSVRGDHVAFGGDIHDRDSFGRHLLSKNKPLLITEAVPPHPELAAIFPGSVNTLRLLMMRDLKSGQGFVASAVLRLGVSGSKGLDNFSRGGLSCSIDLDSGRLGPAIAKRGPKKPFARHPDTDAPISGRTVPFWPDVLAAAAAAFEHCRALHYVGWDVIVSEEGPVILEGNNYSDVNLLQAHAPLLADERIRRFYDGHGILEFRPTKCFSTMKLN